MDAADVVGREAALETIAARLRMGSSVMVPGPRCTGKTVAAEEALRRLESDEPRCLTARVDLFACTTPADLTARLTTAVLANRHPAFTPLASATLARIREVLGRLDVRLKVQDLEVGVGFTRPNPSPGELLDEALDLPERLGRAEGRRVVVLLDEFQEIGRLGGEDLAKRMRATWQRQKHTAYLFLGSYPAVMAGFFTDRHAALFRFADVVPVPVPDRAAWSTYLDEKLGAAGIGVTPPAVSLLLDLTGGHPDDTVRAANEAFSLARALGRPTIDMDTVQEAVDRSIEWLSPAFQAQMAEIGRTGIARAVLRDLAHGEMIYRDGRNASSVRRAVDHLIDLSIVEKSGRGQYRFVEALFARYLRSQLS